MRLQSKLPDPICMTWHINHHKPMLQSLTSINMLLLVLGAKRMCSLIALCILDITIVNLPCLSMAAWKCALLAAELHASQ